MAVNRSLQDRAWDFSDWYLASTLVSMIKARTYFTCLWGYSMALSAMTLNIQCRWVDWAMTHSLGVQGQSEGGEASAFSVWVYCLNKPQLNKTPPNTLVHHLSSDLLLLFIFSFTMTTQWMESHLGRGNLSIFKQWCGSHTGGSRCPCEDTVILLTDLLQRQNNIVGVKCLRAQSSKWQEWQRIRHLLAFQGFGTTLQSKLLSSHWCHVVTTRPRGSTNISEDSIK